MIRNNSWCKKIIGVYRNFDGKLLHSYFITTAWNAKGTNTYWWGTSCSILRVNQDSQCYQRTLEMSLLPYLDQIVDGDAVFQQDNCPIHTSASTRRWLLDHQLHVTDWPSKSPDLNPIENAWGYLVHHVYKDGKQYYY